MKLSAKHCTLIVTLFGGFALAQVSTGTPPFGSFGGGPFDAVNLGNLNSHFSIPVLHKAGRQLPFTYDLSYDSSIWYQAAINGVVQWSPTANWGWTSQTLAVLGFVSTSTTFGGRITGKFCPGGQFGTQTTYYTTYAYVDAKNASHAFPGSTYEIVLSGACNRTTYGPALTATASDGSGYTLHAPANQSGITATTLSGVVVYTNAGSSPGPGTYQDPNGNELTVNNSTGQYFDTLSSTTPVLTQAGSGTPTSPATYTYTASGGNAVVTVNYTQYTVQTAFGFSTIKEYGPTSVALVSSVQLPDGSKYSFTYENGPGSCVLQPGTSSCVTGRLHQAMLPTGGTIIYSYAGGTNNTGIYSDGSTGGLTRALNPGGTWTYTRQLISGSPGPGSTWKTTVVDPSGDNTVINFAEDSTTTNYSSNPPTAATYNFYETQRQIYQGAISGNSCSSSNPNNCLLVSSLTCYNSNYSGCSTATVSSPISKIDLYRELTNNKTALSERTYNAYGLVTDAKEYDFGVIIGSAPTSSHLIRETSTSYGSYNGSTCTALTGILGFPCQVIVYDWSSGSQVTISSSTYSYDQSTPTATSGTPQHVSVTSSRGNLTTAKNAANTTTTLTRTLTYYDTGNVNTATDVNSAVTTIKYGACGNSFPTETDSPLGLTSYLIWDSSCAGGVVVSSKDVNGNTTGYTYDPNFWRVTGTSYPDGGSTTVTYNFGSSSPWNIVTSSKETSTSNLTRQTNLDGLGRVSQTQVTSDPSGTDFVDYAYDAPGRLASVSNPYRTKSDPTYGVTQYGYDALNRVTAVTHPDNTQATSSYAGAAIEVVDEGSNSNGSTHVSKVYQNDGLGRLVSVCEVSSATQVGSTGNPASCGQDMSATGFLTSYTYDALGHITSAAQSGLSNRTYSYDYLGRLTQEWNPESSTTTYTYDSGSSGDLYQRTRPKPNQTGTATDVTTYSFDALHRITGISYNDGSTPSVTFSYDQTSIDGVNPSNPKGRLTNAVAANGSTGTIFGYDTMGRVSEEWQCTPLNCGSGSFALTLGYDFVGDQTSLQNSREGVTYTYTYDAAARLTQLQSSLVDSNHPAVLLTVNTYNPLGEVQKATLGNGIVRNLAFDNRGRVTSVTDGSILSVTLGYAPDSNVLTANDSVNGNWSYSYDDFSRLSTSNKNSGQQTFNYAYDRFGNRWQQNAPQGGPAPQYAFNANNQISGSGVVYDAPGNITNDGLGNSYSYDGENRMITVSGPNSASYVYDAFGNRARSTVNSSTYDFIFQRTQAIDAISGSTWVWGHPGGMMGAIYDNATTYFDHRDWVGTVRARSNVSGASVETCTSLPSGDALNCTGTDYSPLHYTGQTFDWESNLHHFPARQLSTTQGRWISPDPLGLGAVSPSSPQTWNRYAYVANNPLNFVDPTGLLLKGPANTCVGDVNGVVCGGGALDSGGDDSGSGGTGVGSGGLGGFCDASGNCQGIAMCPDGTCSDPSNPFGYVGGTTGFGAITLAGPSSMPGSTPIQFGAVAFKSDYQNYLTAVAQAFTHTYPGTTSPDYAQYLAFLKDTAPTLSPYSPLPGVNQPPPKEPLNPCKYFPNGSCFHPAPPNPLSLQFLTIGSTATQFWDLVP